MDEGHGVMVVWVLSIINTDPGTLTAYTDNYIIDDGKDDRKNKMEIKNKK